MSNQELVNELEQLLSEVNDEDLKKMNDDDIMALRKKLNPYGRTIEGSDKYLNFSITLIRDEFLKKLYTTALVGFLFRMCDEWKTPAGVPVVPVRDYLQDKSLLDTPEVVAKGTDKHAQYDYEFNRKWME